MKKHKVKIPEGYEVERILTCKAHNADNSPRIYKEVIFKPIKKQLPKTWEEYNGTGILFPEWIPSFIPGKYAGSVNALLKLIELKDHYNDGYESDLPNEDKNIFINPVSIYRKEGSDEIIMGGCGRGPLVLHNDIALKFYTNFHDLLETAKPLL